MGHNYEFVQFYWIVTLAASHTSISYKYMKWKHIESNEDNRKVGLKKNYIFGISIK